MIVLIIDESVFFYFFINEMEKSVKESYIKL